MAITWKTKITPISIPDRTVSVSATRTDDVTGISRTFTVPKAKIETLAQKLAVMDGCGNGRRGDVKCNNATNAI